jgi:serine phosphatase RsbU (regulator of sigma subunit)
LKKGDMIYIYSDGYQDQFGGPKGKKYMVKRYRSFLKELSKLPIEEQGVKIQEEFHSWKGNHDQVDDICVMGLRV